MKIIPTKRHSSRIYNVTTAAQEWNIEIPTLTNFKRHAGSKPMRWLYVEIDTASAALPDGKFQYYDGAATNDIATASSIMFRNSTAKSDFGYGYVEGDGPAYKSMIVAIPETALVNRFYLNFGQGNERTGSAWVLYQNPALEGYSPESFGHYYITRHLTTLTIPANENVVWDMPAGIGIEEPMYIYVSEAVGLTGIAENGTVIGAVTLTAGVYTDERYTSQPVLKAYKYARSLRFENPGSNPIIVKIDLPVLSL